MPTIPFSSPGNTQDMFPVHFSNVVVHQPTNNRGEKWIGSCGGTAASRKASAFSPLPCGTTTPISAEKHTIARNNCISHAQWDEWLNLKRNLFGYRLEDSKTKCVLTFGDTKLVQLRANFKKEFPDRKGSLEYESRSPSRSHVKCDHCLKWFSSRFNLAKHKKNIERRKEASKIAVKIDPLSYLPLDQLKAAFKGKRKTKKTEMEHDEQTEDEEEGLLAGNTAELQASKEEELEASKEAVNPEEVEGTKNDVIEFAKGDDPFQNYDDFPLEIPGIGPISLTDVVHLNLHIPNELDKAPETENQFFRQYHLCQTCGKTYRSRKILKAHLLLHDLDNALICSQCPMTFKSKQYMRRHMIRMHLTRKEAFLCDKCGRKMKNRNSLMSHMKCHMDARPFKCSICDSSFKRSSNLRQHEATVHKKVVDATEEKVRSKKSQVKNKVKKDDGDLYACTMCHTTFTSCFGLNVHISKGNCLDKLMFCALCERSFLCDEELCEHIQDKEKPKMVYYCPVKECERSFLLETQLKQHIAVHHVGENPYKCSHCEKAFKALEHFNRHLTVHNGVRFPCPDCDKTFSRKTYLTIHARKHAGLKPFHCCMCGRSFTQKGDCKKHERRIHGLGVEDEELF